MEIKVSPDEFRLIKRNKREIEERFRDINGLERTLREMKLRYLREQRNRLERRLNELEKEYQELSEFEERALADKAFLMEFRKRLSEENRELTQKLGDRG